MIECPTCGDEFDPDEGGMCSCEEQREAAKWAALYRGEKAAGLLRPQEELDRELREAGRGHLVRRP